MANAKFYGSMLSTVDAASYLGVTATTVSNYIRRGFISATDISHGTGRPIYGIREEDLVDFSQRMKKTTHHGKVCYKPAREPVTNKKKSNDDLKYEVLRLKREVIHKTEVIHSMNSLMRELSEELLNLSIKLDELSNET